MCVLWVFRHFLLALDFKSSFFPLSSVKLLFKAKTSKDPLTFFPLSAQRRPGRTVRIHAQRQREIGPDNANRVTKHRAVGEELHQHTIYVSMLMYIYIYVVVPDIPKRTPLFWTNCQMWSCLIKKRVRWVLGIYSSPPPNIYLFDSVHKSLSVAI